MDIYCVKEKQHTPNVKGTEKVVIIKNKRKMLRAKCAVCGNIKSRFLPGKKKLSDPSLPGSTGLLGNVAVTVGDLAIEKGIPYLAKKGFEAGRYYASEAMRNPRLQKKAINYTLNRLIGVIWTVLGLKFTK